MDITRWAREERIGDLETERAHFLGHTRCLASLPSGRGRSSWLGRGLQEAGGRAGERRGSRGLSQQHGQRHVNLGFLPAGSVWAARLGLDASLWSTT